MITPPIPVQEQERLKALRSLRILDTPPEERFDRVTRIVKSIFKVKIVLISLIDLNRQWFKSCLGLDLSETSREISFCAHAINTQEPFIIPDALEDLRFWDNPLVVAEPFIRFYAGINLKSQTNYALGTLCIIDDKPRYLTQEEVILLQELAKLVEIEMNNQELLEANKRIRESEKRYHTLIETLEEGIIVQDQASKILTCNSSAQKMLGISPEQGSGLNGKSPDWTVIQEDGSPFPQEQQPITQCLRTGLPQTNVIMGLHKPAKALTWISVNVLPLFYEELDDLEDSKAVLPYAAVASLVDVTRHKAKSDQLVHQAYHDNLTGLPNRVLFHERLRASLENACAKQELVVVGFLDLDHFKEVNDTLGHNIGDGLLLEAARRMRKCLRHTDTVARLGGDEFGIILNGVSSKEQAEKLAEKLAGVLSQEFVIAENKLRISASIGLSVYPLDSLNEEELVKQADFAMYQAKARRRAK